MYYLITHYSIFAICFLFVSASIGISWLGLFFVSKRVSPETLRENHEVAAAIFDIAGLIYSLILAFVIIAVWEDYEDLSGAIDREAEKLYVINVHATELPDSLTHKIQTAVSEYAKLVVKNEWDTQDGKRINNTILENLRVQLYKVHPEKDSQQKILDHIDGYIDDVAELRQDRIAHNHSQIPTLVWIILVVGTSIVIMCSYLYYVQPAWLHYFFVLLLATLISMSLFLVFVLDHPFEGSSGVSPQPFLDLISNVAN